MSATWEPREGDWIEWLDGTLEPQARARFQRWLDAHPEQARDMRELQELEADLSLMPLPAVDEELMEESCRRVMASLDNSQPAPQRQRATLVRLQRWAWLPAAAAALVLGVVLGRQGQLTRQPLAAHGIRGGAANNVDGVVEVSTATPSRRTLDVQDLAVDARSGVRIRLQETSNYEINGSTADVDVQNTLSYIVRNDREAERRLTAIQLLDEHCSGDGVCQVLIYAMTQDPVASVRREAALALQDDQQDAMVRQSFLKMLVEDPAPELRRLAQGVLEEQGAASAQAQPVGR